MKRTSWTRGKSYSYTHVALVADCEGTSRAHELCTIICKVDDLGQTFHKKFVSELINNI